jgi:response regulator RpfG family c-di-GMP phosphodiesterase
MFGFEVCEIVRRDPALESVKLILIAAIYDRARYKRAPTNLYGADDYIEKHHIPDSLAEKCLRLVGTERAPSSSASTPRENREEAVPRIVAPAQEQQEEASRERIRTAESRPRPDEAMLERARRLARTIVSDIALYNQEKIVEGVRNNNLREVLADEIEEGRQLLAGRLAPDIRDAEPFLDTAIEQLIAAKKKELGIA